MGHKGLLGGLMVVFLKCSVFCFISLYIFLIFSEGSWICPVG